MAAKDAPLNLEVLPIAQAKGLPFEQVRHALSKQLPPTLAIARQDPASALAHQIFAHFMQHQPAPATAPSMAMQIMRLVEDANVDIPKLSHMIKQDPAVATQVMSVANSVVYRRGDVVDELPTAIARIGLQETAQIAAAIAGRSLWDADVRAGFEAYGSIWKKLRQRTMSVAFAASWCSLTHGVSRPERVFFSGLLSKTGASMALRALGKMLATMEPPSVDLVEAAVESMNAELGATTLEIWKLPEFAVNTQRMLGLAQVAAGKQNEDAHLIRVLTGLYDLRLGDIKPNALRMTQQSIHALGLSEETVGEMYEDLGTSEKQADQVLAKAA